MAGCLPLFSGGGFEEGDDCQNGRDDDGDGLVDCEDPNCALLPFCGTCGNGVIDNNEICDDGNLIDGDGCSSRCLDEKCGNGVVEGDEECDDGNLVPADGCSAACKIDFCGDRILERDVEQCEDGNREDGDGCSSTCRAEPKPGCGNFTIDFDANGAPTEECDDGNNTSGDGCSSICKQEFCGDGITEPTLNEECDDADPFKPAGCTFCHIPKCGDFFVTADEQCDDGNTRDGDGCNAHCRQEFCGDGIIQSGPPLSERCDDGNFNCGDGCCGCQPE